MSRLTSFKTDRPTTQIAASKEGSPKSAGLKRQANLAK